ncbi:MAG TPA: SIMPL domain-containing protein [Candidatus Krumholzibacteria bacterium]|nr:SIMPL domain-containing protein [Candidatus Krumholzibacteria bacterium]
MRDNSGAAVLVAIGLALCGWFVGRGFVNARTAERYVSVKGVSERDVMADMALWPLRFTSTDDNLPRAQEKFETARRAVLDFLTRHGIDGSRVELQNFDVTDVLANPYRGGGEVTSRYIISGTLMVRVDDPALVQKASQDLGSLVSAGVVFSSQGGYASGPTFLFSKLNDLKPQMIAEATASAREAAEQFAKDSGSDLGGIRQASQGIFQILPRDRAPGVMEESQINKTVRVVSTVEYLLED